MFAPASQQQQQQKQPAAAATAEEEALKRNTDCVYFLASPLTCKKGSECEYRHSEYARVNPRDCYYWLNGNCLNPKCGFRHPPLDGLLGNQGGAPAGPVHQSHAQAPQSAGKQAVPCVFFQKGMCIKGDRCAFLHVPLPAANKMQQPMVPGAEPFEKVIEEKKLSSANFSKGVRAHVDMEAAPKVNNAGLRGSGSVERYVPQHVGYETVAQKRAVGVPLFTGGSPSTQLLQTHGSDDNNSFHNGKDPDYILRESSPGLDVGEDFDVLVDNELRDSEYYHGEDQYGRRGQDGRNSVNESDPDFSAVPDGDAEAFREHRGFDPYNRMQDRQYDWPPRRASSERGDHLGRKVYSTDERSDHIPESDLRYRLSKHRRGNGLQSVVSCNYAPDHSERGFADSRRDTLHESSISSRLQGRIKLPGRVSGGDTRFERERGTQWGTKRSQLSQGRQGRLRDRIKGRLEDNHRIDQERGTHGTWTKRREMNDDLRAPKRLTELKSGKEESKAGPSLRKRKSLDDHHHQESEDSFAAPLPLSEILKRKRAATTAGVGSGDEKNVIIQETKQENQDVTIAKEEDEGGPKPAAEEKPKLGHEEETNEGRVVGEDMAKDEAYEGMAEDQAYEGDDQNGEYYYEQGYEEDGEYNYEEGENAEVVEEEGYTEEEEGDGNEFAKKMGVML